jgi:hypothetical protein
MNQITETTEKGQEFTLEKKDDCFEVSSTGNLNLLSIPGVFCENPDALEPVRIYKKRFSKNKIFMPNEYSMAVSSIFFQEDQVIIGMNGFTNVKHAEWGVKPGAYEAACTNLLTFIIESLTSEFRGIKIGLVNGASDLGVDASIFEVAKLFNLPLLGHSCPHFLMYAKDDGFPIYVAEDELKYSHAFTETLDILVTANGGQITFRHDIDAAFNKGKHVLPLKVLQAISTTGGPPAFDSEGRVVDAVTAFEQRVHMIAVHLGVDTPDKWQVIKNWSKDQVISICRSKISPKRAFFN